MTDARALRERVAEAICRDNRNGKCSCESDGMCLSSLWNDAASAAIDIVLEEAARVVLEQRCERGTPWDNACLDAAAAIRALAGGDTHE